MGGVSVRAFSPERYTSAAPALLAVGPELDRCARDLGEVQRHRLEAAAVRALEILENRERPGRLRGSQWHAHVDRRDPTTLGVDDDGGDHGRARLDAPGAQEAPDLIGHRRSA